MEGIIPWKNRIKKSLRIPEVTPGGVLEESWNKFEETMMEFLDELQMEFLWNPKRSCWRGATNIVHHTHTHSMPNGCCSSSAASYHRLAYHRLLPLSYPSYQPKIVIAKPRSLVEKTSSRKQQQYLYMLQRFRIAKKNESTEGHRFDSRSTQEYFVVHSSGGTPHWRVVETFDMVDQGCQ